MSKFYRFLIAVVCVCIALSSFAAGKSSRKLDEELLSAALAGCPVEIEYLIQQGANVNTKNKYGITPLMYATGQEYNNLPLFLKAGADVNAKDKKGRSALMYAVTKNEDNYLHAEDMSSLEKIQTLIEAKADLNAKDKKGKTALMMTTDARVREMLLGAGAKADIRTAVEMNRLDLLQQLIDEGVNLETRFEKKFISGNGNTALLEAASHGNVDMVNMLIKAGANVNAKNKHGDTALMLADNPQIVRALIEAGVDVNAKNKWGKTALMGAYSLEKMQELLKAGADVNAKDKNGETALSYNTYPEKVRALVSAGSKDINLYAAVALDDLPLVKKLLAEGADPNGQKPGVTPLMHVQSPQVAKTLIEAGADVNAKAFRGGVCGWTALMFTENVEIAKLLIAAGADVNVEGWPIPVTALTVHSSRPAIVKELLKAGAKKPVEDPSTRGIADSSQKYCTAK